MVTLLTSKAKRMRRGLVHQSIHRAIEEKQEKFARPESIAATRTIQRYYRSYRAREMVAYSTALVAEKREQERRRQLRLGHRRKLQRKASQHLFLADTSRSASAIMIQRFMRFVWQIRRDEKQVRARAE